MFYRYLFVTMSCFIFSTSLYADTITISSAEYGLNIDDATMVQKFHHDRGCTPRGNLKTRRCGIPGIVEVTCWCRFDSKLEKFAEVCNGETSCSVDVNNSNLDAGFRKDPCPNACKVAKIKWKCGDGAIRTTFVAEKGRFVAQCN